MRDEIPEKLIWMQGLLDLLRVRPANNAEKV